MTRGNNRETILKVAFTLLIFFFLGVGAIDPCMTPLENIAVYEGAENTFIPYPANRNGVKLTTSPTTDEIDAVVLVNNNDAVDPNYEADYAFNSSAGLTIKKATTKDKPGHPLSTAGLYTAECGGNRFSFKFLVVRQGPTCSCTKVNSSTVQVTCSSIYADSIYDPIAAIFTLFVKGRYNTSETPQRTKKDAYTWISTTTFTAPYRKPWIYQCIQTFDEPTEIQDSSVAINAPKFLHNDDCSC